MRLQAALLLLGAIFVTGCSTTIAVSMQGSSDMNSGGNAAVVQVYELSGTGNFQNLSFRSFWQKDGSVSKVVGSPQQKTVYPDELTRFEMTLEENTKYIGVAANLRSPESKKWRVLYPVEEVGDWINVVVRTDRISVDVEGKGALQKVGLSGR